ncbi:MAG: alpha/beta hydrolase [Oscillospiraceae bacterium]|jgi:acetyl esterase/lipase|nr:alpha/beta hydrolase [Oscillospiraceae bacterium]
MENLQLIPPTPMFGGPPFPNSEELPEGAISVKWEDKPSGAMLDFKPNVVYQSLGGEEQHVQVLMPASMFAFPGAPKPKYPLIAYVPGSAWMRQNVMASLPRMIQVAQAGYVVAIIEYRPTDIGAAFPAQVEDAEAAIRFVLEHAEEYGVDTSRVAVWGDSSGGHTAISVGIRGNVHVSVVADWYAPTEIAVMNYYPSGQDHIGADSPEGRLIGNKNVLENPELAAATSPLNWLSADKPTPPILIMHGSADNIVPFNQSVRLYEKLRELGKETTFYKVEGGGHGSGGFGSDECLKVTLDYIAAHI